MVENHIELKTIKNQHVHEESGWMSHIFLVFLFPYQTQPRTFPSKCHSIFLHTLPIPMSVFLVPIPSCANPLTIHTYYACPLTHFPHCPAFLLRHRHLSPSPFLLMLWKLRQIPLPIYALPCSSLSCLRALFFTRAGALAQ